MRFVRFCAIKALLKSIQALFGPEIIFHFPKPTCPPAAANCCSCAEVRIVMARLGWGRWPGLEGGVRGGRTFRQLSPQYLSQFDPYEYFRRPLSVSLPHLYFCPTTCWRQSLPALGSPAVTVYSVYCALWTVCVQCREFSGPAVTAPQ